VEWCGPKVFVGMAKTGKHVSHKKKKQAQPDTVFKLHEGHGTTTPIVVTKGVQRALATAGHSAGGMRLGSLIRTQEDRFHAGLLVHMLDNTVIYPLPGLSYVGLAGCTEVLQGGGSAPFTYTPQAGAGPYTTASSSAFMRSSRYGVFHGAVQTEVSALSNSSGALELWVWLDPLDVAHPLKIIDATTVGSPTWTAHTTGTTWSDNPFVITQDWISSPNGVVLRKPEQPVRELPPGWARVAPVVDAAPMSVPVEAPVFDVDRGNFYYVGGAALQLQHVNRDAYTTAAFRVRRTDNVTHRFFDTLDALGTTNDLGFRVPFEAGTAAFATYSGSMWDTARRPIGNTDPTGSSLTSYLCISFNRCWEAGYPFIQVRCKTTSGASSVRFSVSGRSWMGIAPKPLDRAGAMPFETVPFSLPGWFSVGRVNGVVGREADKAAPMAMETMMQLQPQMGSSTPLQRAVAVAPRPVAAVAQLAEERHVQNHNPSLAEAAAGGVSAGMFLNSIKGRVGSFFSKVIKDVGGKAVRSDGQYLGRAGTQIARLASQRLLPFLMEGAAEAGAAAEAVAPLAIMV